MAHGHKVKIASHSEFRKWVEGYGIEYAEIAGGSAPTVNENEKSGSQVGPGENDSAEPQPDASTGDAATPGTASSAWQANKG